MKIQKKNYHHGNLAEAILLRAAEIIDERGIEALSLRSVARDLDVSHSAPNRHFKSKTDLLSALALDGWLKSVTPPFRRQRQLAAAIPIFGLMQWGGGTCVGHEQSSLVPRNQSSRCESTSQ